jgi:hypothetical protein
MSETQGSKYGIMSFAKAAARVISLETEAMNELLLNYIPGIQIND